jgi:signal transduction histidine kinase/CheY-like chemotaxis protein
VNLPAEHLPQPLARRYARQVAGVSVLLLLCAAATEGYFGYRQARTQMAALQVVQARAAAAEIEQYLRTVTRALAALQALPWGRPDFGPSVRRAEVQRLLTLQPAVVDVQDLGDDGQERLFVSRTQADRGAVSGHADAPAGRAIVAAQAGFGPPFFDDAGVPNVTVTLPLADADGSAGRTRLTLNLRFLGDVVSGLRTADGARVYVVDHAGQLIAHPDPTQVLRQVVLREHAPVLLARQALADNKGAVDAFEGPGLDGRAAITTAVRLDDPAWTLFVEQPRSQALEPALATVQRMLLLVVGGGAVALLVSTVSARRMAAPIARLREATASLASGELGRQLQIDTGDEIGLLARDFNTMSEQLRQSYRELEDKVARRTVELAQRRDEAERANAAKTRFLAAASHDLRQPMHAIGLLVGLLRQRLQEAELHDLADKTNQAVESMEDLFRSLLDISKLDAGAVHPHLEANALQPLLERAVGAYAPLATAKGLRLRLHPTRIQLRTDAALLERIVGNLLANAIAYTPRGGVLLGCRRRGDGWSLQVIDTGIGIPIQHQRAVFEEFVRLDPGSAGDRGLGLGLSIVQRTAGLLGLALDLRSTPGRGSVFELRLPATLCVESPAADTLPSVASAASLRGAFVLVVDDDTTNLQATTQLLSHWGCLVAAARSEDDALHQLQEHLRAPEVILTDFQLGLPGSGLGLIRAVREQLGESVPALLVTADIGIETALEPGVQVLHKPVGVQRLQEALHQALNTAQTV